jgi:hypothetical protein
MIKQNGCKGMIEHIMQCIPYPRGAYGRRFERSVTSNYGFTDSPPSLPLPRSDPVTRNYESN